ncbi:MAG: hypothetical protein CMF49_04195 [Legionellales bacterium]|nr:hypothetical protein [Legionellales bacterium]
MKLKGMQEINPSHKSQQYPWQALIILNVYRLVVFIILVLLYINFYLNEESFSIKHILFGGAGVVYFVLALGFLFQSIKQQIQFNHIATIGILSDITFFAFLMSLNQGLLINYGILMSIVVAAGSVLVVGRVSLFFAAWATICVLVTQFYYAWHAEITLDAMQKTGFLCSTFFVIAVISFSLSKRIRQGEQLALEQEVNILTLEKINALIIQTMEQGILVIDDQDRVVVSNKAAWYLLGINYRVGNPLLSDISQPLMTIVGQWREDSNNINIPNALLELGIKPKFTALTDNEGRRKATLIFIEDEIEISKQAQQIKLASLGRLTASIAHEIRNPLSAIIHAVQLIDETALSQQLIRLISIIKSNSRRVNQIVESVLQLSRRKMSVPQKINLSEWLEEFTQELSSGYREPIYIDVKTQLQQPEIMFDSNQLKQVLENICENGLYFSKKKTGEYRLTLNIQEEPYTKVVYLDIYDKGEGISHEAMNYIFEPFYTTKPEGTGLGLYVAREICQANGARITYLNTTDSGGFFRILFL